MRSWNVLPEIEIRSAQPLSRACRAAGLGSLRDLGHHLCELPYGRSPDRADYASVLATGRGTCSSKHAFLAAVAEEQPGGRTEQEQLVVLVLGLYEMTEANTPGVGAALSRGGLECVPEAHCYVTHVGERIDVTRSGADANEAIRFLHEEAILPEQVGRYKVDWHQRHLRGWCRAHELADWEAVWAAREACIAALEAASPATPVSQPSVSQPSVSQPSVSQPSVSRSSVDRRPAGS